MRVHWSLDSPIDATLPPGAMARVIGPTRLVAPSRARHQDLPKVKNIVRAYVELAAPWRRGTCGDFGYITLRVLQPEGPTYFRPASSNDRVFLRDIVPLGVNTSGSKKRPKRTINTPIEEEEDLLDPCTPSTYFVDSHGEPPVPKPTEFWRWDSGDTVPIGQVDSVLLPSSSSEVVQTDLVAKVPGPVAQTGASQLPPLHKGEETVATQSDDKFPTSPTTSSSADSDDLFIIDRKDHFQEVLFHAPLATQSMYQVEFEVQMCLEPGDTGNRQLPLIWWFG
eukprot:5476988-Amphidinium_carterae.1